jgi:multidrug resistance efflux pump
VSKSSTDTINTYKAELEVITVKPSILNQRIELAEIEIKLAEKTAEMMEARKKVSSTAEEIQELENSLGYLKAAFDRSKSDWALRWPELKECCRLKHEQLQDVQGHLDLAKQQVEEQAKELNIFNTQLKVATQENEKNSKDLMTVKETLEKAN